MHLLFQQQVWRGPCLEEIFSSFFWSQSFTFCQEGFSGSTECLWYLLTVFGTFINLFLWCKMLIDSLLLNSSGSAFRSIYKEVLSINRKSVFKSSLNGHQIIQGKENTPDLWTLASSLPPYQGDANKSRNTIPSDTPKDRKTERSHLEARRADSNTHPVPASGKCGAVAASLTAATK